MKRWKEIGHSFGFNILFPRVCLYGIVPCLLLFGPGNIAWIVYWSSAFDLTVLTLFGSLFLLNLVANLAVSRYLRLHQTALSPYEYTPEYDFLKYTPYFRIQIKDRLAFRHLLKSLRSEHKGQIIWLWLWLDDLLLVPAFLILLVWLPLSGAAWLTRTFKVHLRTNMT